MEALHQHQHPHAPALAEDQRGAAERLLDLILKSGAHLWHNRPGLAANGQWTARPPKMKVLPRGTTAVAPGLFVPAAVELYRRLLEIYQLNPELMARFASYAMLETEWRDLHIASAALMLVQPRAGQPIRDDGGKVDFFDDDYRTVGEAMILRYVKGSTRMLTPKGILRVAELLEVPEIAAINRRAGFADPASKKSPIGRWKSAARQWLAYREKNVPMLHGLVKAGFKQTIAKIARKAGYKPESQVFFEALGWRQKQSPLGHREIGLGELALVKSARFDGMSEQEICERIAAEKLGYKEAVGRLPKNVGLTPAVMAALLPSMSDRDLRLMTPTLESLGLLADSEIKVRWESAVKTATDQRALNIAKNVRSKVLREQLEDAADRAVQNAVKEATELTELEVMFLVDKSGSMEGAIEASKEALSRILAGFPLERLHVASFDTVGTVLRPKTASRGAVQHMLRDMRAVGGTIYGAGALALHRDGLSVAHPKKLILIAAGDEDGEKGAKLAETLRELGLVPAAMALIVSVRPGSRRGRTMRDAAATLAVPFSEIEATSFEDPYQVPRALRALLDAPVITGAAAATSHWVEKVMATPLLEKPVA